MLLFVTNATKSVNNFKKTPSKGVFSRKNFTEQRIITIFALK